MFTDCWEYSGAVTEKGYGLWRDGQHGKGYLVHRLVFEAIFDLTPEVVHHRCHNKRCYNPAHLEGMTHGEHSAHHNSQRPKVTECPSGHLYAEHGRLYKGYWHCRACDRERTRLRRAA